MKDGGDARQYDLEERTARFGKAVIGFAKRIPRNAVTSLLVSHLVRSGTSVGANYTEADDAESRRNFRHKVAICKKEARETKHWLQMVVEAASDLRRDARDLWREAKELHLIFAAIGRKLKD